MEVTDFRFQDINIDTKKVDIYPSEKTLPQKIKEFVERITPNNVSIDITEDNNSVNIKIKKTT
jgi:hypothetical protein